MPCADLELVAGVESNQSNNLANFEDHIVDIREFDVPYHMRVSIDTDIRCGLWYTAHCLNNETHIERVMVPSLTLT